MIRIQKVGINGESQSLADIVTGSFPMAFEPVGDQRLHRRRIHSAFNIGGRLVASMLRDLLFLVASSQFGRVFGEVGAALSLLHLLVIIGAVILGGDCVVGQCPETPWLFCEEVALFLEVCLVHDSALVLDGSEPVSSCVQFDFSSASDFCLASLVFSFAEHFGGFWFDTAHHGDV